MSVILCTILSNTVIFIHTMITHMGIIKNNRYTVALIFKCYDLTVSAFYLGQHPGIGRRYNFIIPNIDSAHFIVFAFFVIFRRVRLFYRKFYRMVITTKGKSIAILVSYYEFSDISVSFCL